MGLGRDNPGRKSKTSDYDVSSSGARSNYQTNEETNVESESERLWEDWKLSMWWDIMYYDLYVSPSSFSHT